MEASSEQRNVELTRLGFEAYNAGDYEALARLLHTDVELHADGELINGGDYRGHEGFMRASHAPLPQPRSRRRGDRAVAFGAPSARHIDSAPAYL